MRRQEQLLTCNKESCKVSVLLPFIQEDYLDYLKPQRFLFPLIFLLFKAGEVSNFPKIEWWSPGPSICKMKTVE